MALLAFESYFIEQPFIYIIYKHYLIDYHAGYTIKSLLICLFSPIAMYLRQWVLVAQDGFILSDLTIGFSAPIYYMKFIIL